MAQHLPGRAGAQGIGVTDPLTAGQGRVEQGHRLVTGVGRAGCVGEINVGVEQLTQPESLGQAGGKDQASIGDGMGVIEGDGDLIGAVG